MSEIINKIEPEDVEWEMDWDRCSGEKSGKELVFEEDKALAHLLINEVVFLNTYHWRKDWPEEARKCTYVGVNCSDVFAWGLSDAEDANLSDIKNIYKMWQKDPSWGPAIWSMIKRNQMPQAAVEKKIRDAGIWDLDQIKREHALRENYYSGVSRVTAKLKYDLYAIWEASTGKPPLPFDAQWWEGWRRYMQAYPDWNTEAYKRIEKSLIKQWQKANGYEQD